MWDRGSVDHIRSDLLPWEPIAPHELGGEETGLKQVLSRSSSTGAETSLVRVTSPIVGRPEAAVDLYVVAGHAVLNGTELRPGSFVHVPQEAGLQLLPDLGPVVLYAGSFGPMRLQRESGEADPLEVVDVDALEWTDMGWRGDEAPNPAVKIKLLRKEDPLGIAFVVAMLPGWRSPLEESHPVYEESFKVHGDLLLGRRGVVGPGGYFFRPPGSWHGPLYSRTGNMSLIRKDAFGSTDYRRPVAGHDLDSLIGRAYRNHEPQSLGGAGRW